MRLEIRKHFDKLTDVRFIRRFEEKLPFELTSEEVTTRISPQSAPALQPGSLRGQEQGCKRGSEQGYPSGPEKRKAFPTCFQPWGISEKSCVAVARFLSLPVPQNGDDESTYLTGL